MWPLLLLLTLPAAAWLWRRFLLAEVARNAADILADGSADTLRKGYHQRRGWARFWPWLALSALAPAPLAGHWPAYALLAAAVGVALAGYFARYFTPWLNLARGLPEYYASSDSASWPDAAIWRKLRAANPDTDARLLTAQARLDLAVLLAWCWYAALVAAVAGAAVAGFTYLRK